MPAIKLGNLSGVVKTPQFSDSAKQSLFGRGIDGAAVISTPVNINSVAGFSAISAISTNNVTVASAVSFHVGDICLLINLQGNSTRYSRVGAWERVCVSTVVGTTVTFTTNILGLYGENGVGTATNSDLTGQTIMLQRIPEYTSVTLNSGASVSATAFAAGVGGGVVAIMCRTLTGNVGSLVTATAIGYDGGAIGSFSSGGTGAGRSGTSGPFTGGGGGAAGNSAPPTSGATFSGGGGGAAGGGGGYRVTGGNGGFGGGGGGTGGSVTGGGNGGNPAAGAAGGPGGTVGGSGGGTGTSTGGATYGQAAADLSISLFQGSGGGGTGGGGVGAAGIGPFPGNGPAANANITAGNGVGGRGGGIVLIWAETVIDLRMSASGQAGVAWATAAPAGPAATAAGGAGGNGGAGGGAGGSAIVATRKLTQVATATAAAGFGAGGRTGGAGGSANGPILAGGAGASGQAGGNGSAGTTVIRYFLNVGIYAGATNDTVGGYAPLASAFKGTL